MDPPHNCNEQLGPYLQYISRHEQMRHDCPKFGGQYRWKGKKNHERSRRAGFGCITSTLADDGCHVVIGLVLSDDMSRHIRVASLLDMVLWSTGSSRHPDGEEGRYCPRSQCHMLRIGGAPAICAALHSWRKGTIRGMKHSTITTIDTSMIVENRTRKKMNSWVVDAGTWT